MRNAQREITHDVMTVEQVAEYLQLNKMTVYKYIREGKLPASRIGKSYRVRRTDLDVFLEVSRVRPASGSAAAAARALGASNAQITKRDLLPKWLASVAVSVALAVGGVILTEATQPYLGFGIQPPVPNRGNTLDNAPDFI
jgi:excisionase family DNA binding protein